eukprot:642031_1
MKRVFTVGNLDDLRDWVAKIRDTQYRLGKDQGVMCVWGYIRMHIEYNNVIPEELKQLILHFVGEYYFFMKTINGSEHEQIELKVHSHKGHRGQYTPEKMLQSNDDLYITRCTTNDWIIFSIDNDHLYYPTKVQVRGYEYGTSLKNFR